MIKKTAEIFMCSVCGHKDHFNVAPKTAVRDNFRCNNCRSMVRQRDVAQLFMDEFSNGREQSIAAMLKNGSLDDINIYEIGMIGPVWARLSKLKTYTNSYFWDDVPLGQMKDGVRCEDVRKLSFDDNSFDVVLSFEVFEHVFDVDKAIREIARVLKVGGAHIFSMPVRYPLPEKSVVRAEYRQGNLVHLVEPHYHIAGNGDKSLVVTDFGADFKKIHLDNGLRLSIVRRSAPHTPANQNATFIARKIAK